MYMKKDSINIIKVGGAVVEDEAQLSRLLADFSSIEGKKVLVHGGGRRATKVAAELGIETKMVNGRRITDADMLEVVTMVYGGLVNKNVVAKLQAVGVNALGLTGADVDVIEAGITPVMAPLTHDGQGNILNTNADTIAAETAKALAPYYDVTLTFCFEKKGVLSNPDDDDSVIPVITRDDFNRYVADGTIAGGMIPKIENALDAISAGVKRVVITKADALGQEGGTVII